jgi:hypothetical protein
MLTVPFAVTVAAVVVLIDLLRTPIPELETGEALNKRTEVIKAVDRITQIADMSHSAKGSVRVINQLLGKTSVHGKVEQQVLTRFIPDAAELEEKRAGILASPLAAPDASGMTSAANGLHRVVKKLTTDASTQPSTTSPIGAYSSTASLPCITSPHQPIQPLQPTQPIVYRPSHIPEPTVRDDRAAMDLAYGNLGSLFDWDSSQSPHYGSFPMEVSGATNLGMNPHMSVNFDNIELENMLASFMPSRPPSPHQPVNSEITNRTNDFNGDPNHALWPSVERAQDMPNPFGTPYNGWMG